MNPEVEYLPRFEKALKRKWQRQPKLAEAVEETVVRVLIDPENKGLNVHRIKGTDGVWEAYVTKATRLTFERDGDTIIFRNNCRHDIIDRGQW